MKISGNYRFYRGFIEGGESSLPKNGHFKAVGLFLGWVGEIKRKINSFRIIGQGKQYNF